MRVKFPFAAKYRGTYYPTGTPFEAQEGDLDALLRLGAVAEPPEPEPKPRKRRAEAGGAHGTAAATETQDG